MIVLWLLNDKLLIAQIMCNQTKMWCRYRPTEKRSHLRRQQTAKNGLCESKDGVFYLIDLKKMKLHLSQLSYIAKTEWPGKFNNLLHWAREKSIEQDTINVSSKTFDSCWEYFATDMQLIIHVSFKLCYKNYLWTLTSYRNIQVLTI